LWDWGWAYKKRDRGEDKSIESHGFKEFKDPFKTYWNEEHSVGVLERDDKFIGVACLVAKEVTDKESFVRKFGLSFEKDIQWKAASTLLDHLSRSPLFKAVLVTINKIPFKLEPDVPEELQGRLNWAKRNYEFHKSKSESIKKELEIPSFGGPHPAYLPKQMKEEQDHARYFLEATKSLEQQMQEPKHYDSYVS